MSLFTSTKEKKVQLYFRGDGKFQFRTLELEYGCLIERAGDQMIKAWKHFFSTELPFAGYRSIRPAMVTMGHGLDIILDPFNRVPEGDSTSEKPRKGSRNIRDWIAHVAEVQRQVFRTKRKTSYLTNAIIWAEIGLIFLLAIVWAVKYLT